MAFDYVGAIEAGYSPEEIARYLSEQRGFDLDGALKEGYTPQEVIKFLEAPKTGGFGEATKHALKSQYISTKTGIESLLGGTPEDVQRRVEEQAQIKELPGTSWDEVQRKYEHQGLWEAAKEAASQIPGGIGQGVGSMAPTVLLPVAGGVVGGALGSVVPGAGTALGAQLGTAAGTALAAAPYFGANLERQQQEHPGEINKVAALGAAIPEYLLDRYAGVGKVLGSMTKRAAPEGMEALRAASKAARGQSLAGQAARGIGRTAAEESLTEVTQQGLERAQAGLPLTGDEAMKEYKEAGFGALLASPIGAPGRIVEGGRAQSDYLRALQEQRDLRREQPDYEQKAATAAANWDIYNAQATGPGGSAAFLPEGYLAQKEAEAVQAVPVTEPALQEEAPSVQDIINQSTGVSKEAAPTTAKSKAFRDFLNEPSGIMARDPETQVERELTNWEAVQQRQVEPAILMREAAARRELSDISDIEIQRALDQQTQMQIPGLEAGPHTTLPTSEEPTVAGKSAKEAPSTQQELFTKEGELNKTIVEAADLQAARQSPIVSKELLKDIGIKPHPGPKATYNVILNKDASDPTQRGEVIDALYKYLNRVKSPKVQEYLTALEAQHGIETKQTEPAAPVAPEVKQQPTVQEAQATPAPEITAETVKEAPVEEAPTQEAVAQEGSAQEMLTEEAVGGAPSPVRITNKQAKATASAIKDYYKSVDAKEPKQQLVDKRSALMSLPGVTPQTLERYDSFKTPKARNDAINAFAEEPNLFHKGATQGRPLDSKAMQHAAKGDLNGLIRHLANTHENKDVRRVLNKVQGLGLKSSLVLGGNTAGSYDAATNTVSLHPEHGVNDHTAVHEIIHAAISHVLANPHHPLTKEFQAYFDQIQNQLGDVYGTTSLQEFAAELVGNPEFQVKLKNIQSPSGQSMFRRIAQAIAEFFGFKKGQSAYEKGIDMVERAIDVSQNTPSNFADTLYMGMGKPVKEVLEAMKHVDKEAINAKEAMLDAFSNLKDSTKYKLFIDSLGLDNIADLLSSRPQASTDVKNLSVTMSNLVHNLSKTIDLRSGEMAKRIHDTSNKFITMQKAYSRHTKAFKDMSKLAIEARLESVDPLKGADYQPNKDNPVAYNRILQQYIKLPADVKAAYATMRGDFEKARQDYLDIMFNSIDGLYKDNPSVAAALKKKYETDPKVIAYVPFSRHGDFVLEFDVSGERNVLQFESSRQRQAYVAKHLKGVPYKLYERLQDVTYDASSVGRQSLIGQVMNELQKTGATQDQLNSIYQIHLSMFPAESISKHFMKSDDVKGMSEDLLRNYTDVMLRWDRKLVSTKYMGRINADIQAAKDLADKVQDPLLHSTAQSLLDRRGFINNPTHSSWSNKATAFSYYQFIAGNISSAFVNLAVIPTVVIPKLAAMHSGSKALNAMDLAMRTGLKDWSKIPKYRKLYEEMMDRNQLTHTLDKEALEGRAMSSEGYTGLTAKAATLLSIPFAASEKYNRAVTAIAAYDLYLSKHPGKVDDAIEHAVRLVKNVHTSGMAASGSKLFHSNIGRIFFTFKSFAWNSAYNIARTAYLAWKGEDKATVQMARRQLLMTYGAAGAFSGVAGLPFYGMASTLFAMMNAMFGDDDEPTTLDEELKAALGEGTTHGVLGALLNLNIGQRTSLANDLLLRDNPRMIEQHGRVLTYMAAMFGPAGAYALGAGDSLGLIQNGHVERGLEGLIPSFARNALKGARYMAEGAQTIKGDYVKEDVSTYNSLMQIIGFAPADLSEIQGISAARKRLETAIFNEKKRLLDEYDMGYRAGDSEYMKEVQEKITAFNQRHPYKGIMITPDTIARSRRTRLANEKFMLHGIRFNKHLIQELQSKYPEPDESEDSEI